MRGFCLTFGLSLVILGCSNPIPNDSMTSAKSSSSSTTFPRVETTTTIVEIVVPSELDFIAVTTEGETVDGRELWLDGDEATDNLSQNGNRFGQDVLFWFWAPN